MKKDKPFNYHGTIIRNQTELFNFIYENREWKSEIDGSPLPHKGHYQWHFCFGHLLPKGAYPSMKLDPENIMLMTPDQHMSQENYGAFLKRQDEMREKYYQQNQIKKL